MAKEIIDLDSLKGADELMDKVIKTCHDINDDVEMWRLIDEDHARRNIGAEREAVREKAHKEGLEAGLAEGLAKGKAEGVVEGRKEVAKNMKEMGLTLEQIEQATGLSKVEIEKL